MALAAVACLPCIACLLCAGGPLCAGAASRHGAQMPCPDTLCAQSEETFPEHMHGIIGYARRATPPRNAAFDKLVYTVALQVVVIHHGHGDPRCYPSTKIIWRFRVIKTVGMSGLN